jgi:ferric iron reductase protein FhuF
MIPGLAAIVPESLAAMSAKMVVGGHVSRRCAQVRDGSLLDEATDRFGAAYRQPDRRALASLWSQYYFAALIIPATAALLCLDRVLPVALDDLALDLEPDGQVCRFRLDNPGHCRAVCGARFDVLVREHLEPFIDACATRVRLSPRVLWSNAATMFDYAVHECSAKGNATGEARAEAMALLADPRSPLGAAFRIADDGSRTRRVCCLRYRLPGVASCGALCPLEASCATVRTLRASRNTGRDRPQDVSEDP